MYLKRLIRLNESDIVTMLENIMSKIRGIHIIDGYDVVLAMEKAGCRFDEDDELVNSIAQKKYNVVVMLVDDGFDYDYGMEHAYHEEKYVEVVNYGNLMDDVEKIGSDVATEAAYQYVDDAVQTHKF